MRGQRRDRLKIGKAAVLCAVQIHHMQLAGPRRRKAAGNGAWVGGIDGFLAVIALIQAHDLAVLQVDGWQDTMGSTN